MNQNQSKDQQLKMNTRKDSDRETKSGAAAKKAVKHKELDRWENEGGEVPTVPTPKEK